ncbi:UvrD-helicase-domain-containing protein [Artomyces pyxidatus]|uniref:UvrD-helicase-domain-containing protein n=1 Tax=Artomyces pyxidatus TaxID=48021 RepID=A0ACB8T9C7_9AGAM|nr:UvrD-helicase-domain-containing protein [Artomyces pyxidatus]
MIRIFKLLQLNRLRSVQRQHGNTGKISGAMEVQNGLLHNLNEAQSQSVQHPPHTPLQILAGPGSGKTKVLTSRIAYLILQHRIPPSSICAVTFTNKAANEMKERLEKLIGKEKTRQLKMGTFHALCARFLRKYGRLAGLEENFTISDADESSKLVTKFIKARQQFLHENNITLKPGTVCSLISKAKAKGFGPNEYLDDALTTAKTSFGGAATVDNVTQVVAEIFREYELTLRRSNGLDFDDLLVYGVKLFKNHKRVVNWCRHVLVDEFQDTNSMQYKLMKYIAEANRCVTVVGDPDQSIYGWRSADIENLRNMQRDFPTTVQIFLEQNYRSTGSILAISLAIISKDPSRIQKSLRTTHAIGPSPMLRCFPTEHSEALFIAAEIKRVIAYSGGMLSWKDFVILLRFNALSRVIEAALQIEGIPNRVLNGHKFFERAEIKDLLSYLQLVDNSQFNPAFRRIVNIPSRGIGEKSLAEIFATAERLDKSPLAIVEGICDGVVPDIKPAVKRKVEPFVKIIRTLRKHANEGMEPAQLIRRLLHLTAYEDYLKKTQEDWQTRWENVKELISFASQQQEAQNLDVDIGELYGQPRDQEQSVLDRDGVALVEKPDATEVVGKATVPDSSSKETPLRLFLQASMLSTDVESKDDEINDDKVTLSTCHAAKGLEWPVVMVPAVEDGVYPFSRTESVEEERRLLYVACTRAQGLLYLSHVESRMVAGSTTYPDLSDFIGVVVRDGQDLLSPDLPDLASGNRDTIARVINRPSATEIEVTRRVSE